MLREQFLRAFAFLRPGAVARLQPELTLLLDLLVRRMLERAGECMQGRTAGAQWPAEA